MSNAETIKDFLVSLGFDIDSAGERKFSAVLAGVTSNLLKVGAVAEGAALAVLGFTTKIASGLDKVYWASQRTGASVAGIKALGYAASQTGSDAAAAQGSLENLARFMRNSPGAEGFLNRLGVQTRGANGQMRDTSAVFTALGDKLSKMPTYRANQYAQMLGIDENTLMAMRRGLAGFTADYQSMLQKTGFNADKAAAQSNKFMTSMRGMTELMGILRDKIGSNLAGGLAGSLDSLRKRILDNFPKIEETITTVIKGILWFADAFSRMVYRLVQGVGEIIDWWKRLDEGSKNLLKIFGAILVAWRLLNSAFLMSPIGFITALILAIALLYDDYKTWKEGGKSLIDWSEWQPGIEKAITAIKDIISFFDKCAKAVGGWENVLKGLMIYMGSKWLLGMLGPIGKVSSALLAFPGLFTTALTAAGLYAVVAAINEAYERTKALINGEKYDQIPTHTEEMNELDRLKRENWESNNPGVPYPNPGAGGLNWLPGQDPGGPTPDSTDPRGIRNNNPGNIDFRGQAGATLERPGGRFAKFETAYEGLAAMSNQLMRYYEGKTTGKKLRTIADIISTWAPGNENNTEAYIAHMSKTMGVSPNTVLNLKDPQIMASLMSGIIQKENGRNPYSGELIRQAAGGGRGPLIQQETNIHVHGGGDARETAKLTAEQQNGVNAQVIQKLQTRPT